jgi:hypothetical protein
MGADELGMSDGRAGDAREEAREIDPERDAGQGCGAPGLGVDGPRRVGSGTSERDDRVPKERADEEAPERDDGSRRSRRLRHRRTERESDEGDEDREHAPRGYGAGRELERGDGDFNLDISTLRHHRTIEYLNVKILIV